MSKRKAELLARGIKTIFGKGKNRVYNSTRNTNSNTNLFDDKVTPVTNQQINRAKNQGFFTVPSTGEIDYTRRAGMKQFFPARKTVLNNPETMSSFRDTGVVNNTGIASIGRILANRQYPGLNIPKGKIPKATKKFVGMTDKQIAEYKAYSNSLQRAHPLMSDSRKELSNQFLPYVENPSFLTTGYRNMGSHKHYEGKMTKYLDRKSDLVDKFKNKEISKGQFLMDKAGLDASIKNTTRDMRKLGLESMIFDKANNKFKYYGGLYDNMAQLYKNMGDDYFLQNPNALVPAEVSPKYFETLMGIKKPSTKEGLNIKGELVPKDADDAMKLGEGQWWSKKIKNKEGKMENRGRNNFGGYWRTMDPFMKNRGSNQNLNAGGLISMLGKNELQGMAKSLSPKQVKMLTRQGPR